MKSFDTNALASEIFSAYTEGGIIAPPSTRYEDFNLASAYEVEAEFKKLRSRDSKPVGLKVGYANKAVWRALKLDTLVWGHMYEDTVRYATGELALRYYRSPKIEPEIVFKLKGPVGENPLAAVEWVAIGFEVIHCPYAEWQFKPADFVAAFGLHLALVVGEPLEVTPDNIHALAEQLAQFKLKLYKGEEMVDEGAGKNSLRSPALCLAELARVAPLGADDLVSSGTLTNGQAIQEGETWRVELQGIGLKPLKLSLV